MAIWSPEKIPSRRTRQCILTRSSIIWTKRKSRLAQRMAWVVYPYFVIFDLPYYTSLPSWPHTQFIFYFLHLTYIDLTWKLISWCCRMRTESRQQSQHHTYGRVPPWEAGLAPLELHKDLAVRRYIRSRELLGTCKFTDLYYAASIP